MMVEGIGISNNWSKRNKLPLLTTRWMVPLIQTGRSAKPRCVEGAPLRRRELWARSRYLWAKFGQSLLSEIGVLHHSKRCARHDIRSRGVWLSFQKKKNDTIPVLVLVPIALPCSLSLSCPGSCSWSSVFSLDIDTKRHACRQHVKSRAVPICNATNQSWGCNFRGTPHRGVASACHDQPVLGCRRARRQQEPGLCQHCKFSRDRRTPRPDSRISEDWVATSSSGRQAHVTSSWGRRPRFSREAHTPHRGVV